MCISTEQAFVLVEVKVDDVSLTDSQPGKYLEYILQSVREKPFEN